MFTAYLVTAFIQKPPPIFASAPLRRTSEVEKKLQEYEEELTQDGKIEAPVNIVVADDIEKRAAEQFKLNHLDVEIAIQDKREVETTQM